MRYKTATNNVDLNKTLKVTSFLTSLKQGVYVIRYLAVMENGSEVENVNVPLSLSRAPIDLEGRIEFISSDDKADDVLHKPGDYRVLKVTGDVVLSINKYLPIKLVDSVQVRWDIESLSKSASRDETLPKSNALSSSLAPPKTERSKQPEAKRTAPMLLTGHIENKGDVTVKNDEWLGHPFSKERIEGITFKWINKPAKLELRSVCMVQGKMLQAVAGELLGTVKQAKPINELAFVLEGENADQYDLLGDAAFSDGKIIPISERERLVSVPGSYLVGLRLVVAKKQVVGSENASDNQISAFLSKSDKKNHAQSGQTINQQQVAQQAPNYSVWMDTKKTKIINS